ncbi:MAG: ATP-binding protein [Bacteroidales bacterium]|nr:ATP-binding protein [Bacteroidales bacterium]MDD3961571.1 ATP-binding protein [Bacteroidales bacterium]HPE86079.1 ATP-binding protein [Bacteroidales bacterium]
MNRINDLEQQIADLQNELAGYRSRSPHLDTEFRKLIENLNDLVVRVDNQDRFLYVSRSYCETFGKNKQQLLGKSFMPLVHPDDQKSTDEEMKKLQEPPYTCKVRQRALTQFGWRWLEWNDKALLDDQGRIMEVIGLGRDITEVVQAENALNASKNKLQTAFDMLDNAVWEIDFNTGTATYSSVLVESLPQKPSGKRGYNSREISTQLTHLVHPDDRDSVFTWGKSLLTNKPLAHEIEYRFLFKDRGYIWVRNKIRFSEFDARGNPLRLIGVQYEIEKEKRSDIIREKFNALNSLDYLSGSLTTLIDTIEKLLSTIFEGFRFSVCFYQEIESYYSCSSDRNRWLKTEKLCVLFNQKKLPLLHLSKPMQISKYCELSGGETPPVSDILVFPYYRDEFLTGFIGLSRQESHKKFSEQDIALYSSVVEQIWVHVQYIHAKKFLYDSQRKTIEAERLKANFIANISHELRTPLNSIIGFSSLIARGSVHPNDQEKYSEIISTCGKTLLNLVNDIIDLSKIDAGEITVNFTSCLINNLLDQLLVSFTRKITAKEVRLELQKGIEDKFFSIQTDIIRLKQIFTNLLENAVKFTSHGTIVFGYRFESNQLIFFVSDTGIGIAPDMTEQIFNPFFQVEAQTTRKYRGSGLGLTITRRLVELLGGRISVQSEQGKGSEFCFTIDIQRTISVAKEAFLIDKKINIPNLYTKTILIHSEFKNDYLLINEILKPTFASTIWSGQPDTLLKSLDHTTIDLLVLDINLQEELGFNLLESVKKIRPALAVIVQTSSVRHALKTQCLKAGCASYLLKPYQPEDFMEAVNGVLS